MAYQNTNIATLASNLRAVIGQNLHKVQVTNMIAAANKTNPTCISTKYICPNISITSLSQPMKQGNLQ